MIYHLRRAGELYVLTRLYCLVVGLLVGLLVGLGVNVGLGVVANDGLDVCFPWLALLVRCSSHPVIVNTDKHITKIVNSLIQPISKVKTTLIPFSPYTTQN